MTQEQFMDRLMSLCYEAREGGLTTDEIVSEFEMRQLALEEEDAENE
ncbi:hypothetical protein [uncultured Roseibium sp.]|nr:hypothetical protein [uncultured Roseibium sp.]